jgi:Fic family protein
LCCGRTIHYLPGKSEKPIILALDLDIYPDSEILNLLARLTQKLGLFVAFDRERIPNEMQRRTDIIHATMRLEGYRLPRKMVLSIVRRRIIQGPRESLKKAAKVRDLYEAWEELDPCSQNSLHRAFRIVSGFDITEFREFGMPIFRGPQISGMSPPPDEIIPGLERLFRKLSLSKEYPIFSVAPVDPIVCSLGKQFREAIGTSEKKGSPTEFIRFMLQVFLTALDGICPPGSRALLPSDRIMYFYELGKTSFTRKDYLSTFGNISPATASRDLSAGVSWGLFEKRGNRNTTVYRCLKP